MSPAAARRRRVGPRCRRVAQRGLRGPNYGGASPNDVPGYRAAEAFRGAESMDREEMSPVWWSKDAGGRDVSTAGQLRRSIVRLRNRVTEICRVHPERSEGSAFRVILLS